MGVGPGIGNGFLTQAPELIRRGSCYQWIGFSRFHKDCRGPSFQSRVFAGYSRMPFGTIRGCKRFIKVLHKGLIRFVKKNLRV